MVMLAVLAAGARAVVIAAPARAHEERAAQEAEAAAERAVVPNPAASEGLPMPALAGGIVIAFAVGLTAGHVQRRRRVARRREALLRPDPPVAPTDLAPPPAPPASVPPKPPRVIAPPPPPPAPPPPTPPAALPFNEEAPPVAEPEPVEPPAPPEPEPVEPPAPPEPEPVESPAPAEPVSEPEPGSEPVSKAEPAPEPVSEPEPAPEPFEPPAAAPEPVEPPARAPEVPRREEGPPPPALPLGEAIGRRVEPSQPPTPQRRARTAQGEQRLTLSWSAAAPARRRRLWPSARRFARERPWPEEAETLWTCEIAWKPGYVKSTFRAMAGPPGGEGRRRSIGESPPLKWTLMTDPEPPTPEMLTGVRALVQALVAAGWERTEPGPAWYAQRFLWRGEGEPGPVEVPEPTESAEPPSR